MDPFGLTWTHLDSLGLPWIPLLIHSDSLGLTWIQVEIHFDSVGLTCTHVDSLGLTWILLDPKRNPVQQGHGRDHIARLCMESIFRIVVSSSFEMRSRPCPYSTGLCLKSHQKYRHVLHIFIILGYGETRFLLRPSAGNDHN